MPFCQTWVGGQNSVLVKCSTCFKSALKLEMLFANLSKHMNFDLHKVQCMFFISPEAQNRCGTFEQDYDGMNVCLHKVQDMF